MLGPKFYGCVYEEPYSSTSWHFLIYEKLYNSLVDHVTSPPFH